MSQQSEQFKKLIAHCKEYGFIFQSSEVYDGLSAVYDYGPNGVELKNNIKKYWWQSMVQMHENIVGIDAAIFMHPKTWKASGKVNKSIFLAYFLPCKLHIKDLYVYLFRL